MVLTPANRARLNATLACGGLLLLWWRVPGMVTGALATVAIVLAVLAYIAPRTYAPIQRGLDAGVRALLVAITWLALALVYFGAFVPLRLWWLVSRHDPLHRRPTPSISTYFRPLSLAPSRFDRQF